MLNEADPLFDLYEPCKLCQLMALFREGTLSWVIELGNYDLFPLHICNIFFSSLLTDKHSIFSYFFI